MKICPSPCSTKFNHPTRDKCSKCSGWSCVKCGRPKPSTNGKETCDRVECNKIEKARRNRMKKPASNVRKIAERMQ